MAAERADLEHPAGPSRPDEELEEPSRDRAGEHLARAERAVRLLRQRGEPGLVRRGDLLGVVLEAFVDVHRPTVAPRSGVPDSHPIEKVWHPYRGGKRVMIAARLTTESAGPNRLAADRRRTALTRKGKLSVLGALVACLVVAGLAGAAQQTHASSSVAVTGCQLHRRQGRDQARHLHPVRQRPLSAGQPERPVRPRADAAPAELHEGQRHASDTNDHTILISHTGGGILSSLTGLYPDRHGQAVSNSYNYFRPDGTSGFSSTFKYWTDVTDGGNPATVRQPPSADTNYNMVNADPPSLGGTGAARNAPARGSRTRAPVATSATSASRTPSSRTTMQSSSEPARPPLGGRYRCRRDERQRSRTEPASRQARRSRSTLGPNIEQAMIATVGPGTGNAGTALPHRAR